MLILEYFKKLNHNKFGYLSFYIGIFLLFSAPLIASLFLLISILLSIFLSKKNPLADKINIVLILISFLMITSCIIYKLNYQGVNFDYSSKLNTQPFIALVNWIPLFFSYLGFQYYLRTEFNRYICGLCLIFGSVPILISGFGQYFFNWYGPLDFLNGLIIWYQRENESGMTSFFNNPNYAGCALATVFPFFCATFFKNKNFDFKKIINLILLILVILGIFFTSSRNGFISLFLGAFIFLIPLRSKLFSFGFLSFGLVLLLNFIFNYIFNSHLIPLHLANKISYQGLFTDPRILIWKNSIIYISKKPFLGWGGNSFSSIWNSENSFYLGHSHSIPLEISIQYGIVTSVLLFVLIVFILSKSFRLIFLDTNFRLINFYKENFFDRAWYSACLVILFSNTIDILYFDIRISILTWVFLAGLRSIALENIK